MAEILSTVSVIDFILSGVFLIVAVFCWFKFQIPAVIGDLSGRTARKSIAKMREDNERKGRNVYRPGSGSAVFPETGVLADNRAEKVEKQQTVLLQRDDSAALGDGRSEGKTLIMLDEVMLIHTDEEIELER